LPDPAAPERPLVVAHEVVAIPSTAILRVLRGESVRRTRPARSLLVLADPVFARDDPRVAASSRGAAKAGVVALPEAARDAGVTGGLPRLPFSRREALAILELAPREARRGALDFAASRATATARDLGTYRFVHFATHGFLNPQQPELSGLVFSLVDRNGRDQPGFLAAPEIFNLRLSADLVVLSGCRTALGKEVSDEGLVGLTRAFMYAGAPRVLASLWPIDDAATAALMSAFYRGILKDGLSPAAALRRAQAEAAAANAPYFWAAFQLYGDWR
jgi:CHAT domain-containing protein